MTVIRSFTDGLVNLVSGMGTKRSKAGQAENYFNQLPDAQLLAAYRSSAMIRRATDLPAEDSVREWRAWQANKDQIEKLEAEEKRLMLKPKLYEARRRARLFGGSAILIGDGASNPALPLNLRRLGSGGIKYLTVISKGHLTPSEMDLDPLSPTYEQPLFWSIKTSNGNSVRIHPSRMAIFQGVPTIGDSNGMFIWGDSILQAMMEALNRVDEGANNINALLYEAKIDILGINNFMEDLKNFGKEYESVVQARAELVNVMKGINSVVMMDKEDVWEQKTMSFGGLPDVLMQFMQLASAAAGLPMTLLFGMSPAGLNATGDNDVRNYYDRVKTHQTLHMSPTMTTLDEAIIYSSLGSRPTEVHYTWNPLWQPTAKEVSEDANNRMEALTKLNALGSGTPPEAIGEAAVNALTECGAFPGLEGAVEKYFTSRKEEDDESNPGVAGMPEGEDQ